MGIYDKVILTMNSLRGEMKAFRGIVIFLLCAAGLGVVASPLSAYGYVGPGAGFTVLGSLWAVIAAVFATIAGILLWVIRALFRLRRRSKQSTIEPQDP
jgi:membrane protein implicated in regulation of membrane protease activity